jgi:hypothetical protein
MKKILNKIVAFFNALTADKYLHLIAGLIVAAFFNIALGMEVCIAPVIVAGFIKEFIDEWRYGGADIADFAATLAGGAVIQLFVSLF